MKRIAVGTILGLALAACGSHTDGVATSSAALVKGPALTAGNAGTAVSINADELLTITLPAQMSTGFGWNPVNLDTKVLKLVGIEQITAQELGGTDQMILRFAGVAAGRTTVNLAYHQPWQPVTGLTAAAKSYSVTVDVRGAYTGAYQDPNASYVAPQLAAADLAPTALPSSFTYCNSSTCTPIKDQGQCGSCWAFATTGTVEQLQKKQNGSFIPLSEQHLVSCNTSAYGCNGGWQGFPWYYNKADKNAGIGTVYASEFPYSAADVACKATAHHDKLANWVQISSGVVPTATLKQALYDHGPLWVALCADSAVQRYTGGVFAGSNCPQDNHAVVLTGWDDATGTWLLRNSWGTGWGESGYMRIKYGANVIGTAASYATLSGSCTPNCTGKVCGSDGCGGSCGSCPVGQACNASGQCQTSTCAHDKCTAGTNLASSCDACVGQICAADSYCCSTSWDSTCVGEVQSVCGQSCL